MPEFKHEPYSIPIGSKPTDFTIEYIWQMICHTESVNMWFYEWYHFYCNHPDCDEHIKFTHNPDYPYQTTIK